MYNIQLDENNFFTGNYAAVGTVSDGVNAETLPPAENSLCYRLVRTEQIKEVKQPILQYIKTVVSETEFDAYYVLQETDGKGNATQRELTEYEYEALSDEDKLNTVVSEFPKTYTVELTKTEYEALSDDEKSDVVLSYKQDSQGNLLYENVEVKETINTWEFSQERYNEIEAEKANKRAEFERYNKLFSVEQQRADIDYIALMTGVDLEV